MIPDGVHVQLRKDIPSQLIGPAEAALNWINETRGTEFQLTGLVESDAALAAKPGETIELGLVLCQGDVCTREQVRVTALGERFEFAAVKLDDSAIPPLLDPPVGVRRTWLDAQLAKHDFIVLLFYRGLW